MVNRQYAEAFCSEDISLIENYDKAVADNTQTWHCHHRWETDRNLSAKELIFCNEYFRIPADRLIFLTPHDHLSLHFKGKRFHKDHKHTPDTKAAISRSRKGKNLGNTTAVGRKWFNNGVISVM